MADRPGASRVLAGLPELPRAFGAGREGNAESGPSPVVAAFEKGRVEGLEAGAAQAAVELRAQCDTLRQAISETVKALVGLRESTTRRHEQAMFELALSAASRMLRDRIEADDPVAARALREALAALPKSDPVAARLHPDDIESVRRDLAPEIDEGQVVLTADDTIERGGCVVESDAGTVDATVETAVAMAVCAATGTDTP